MGLAKVYKFKNDTIMVLNAKYKRANVLKFTRINILSLLPYIKLFSLYHLGFNYSARAKNFDNKASLSVRVSFFGLAGRE